MCYHPKHLSDGAINVHPSKIPGWDNYVVHLEMLIKHKTLTIIFEYVKEKLFNAMKKASSLV